jgi:hypothetical protein
MPIVTDGLAIIPSIVRTIEVRSAENLLNLTETDQTDPAGRWRLRVDGDKVYLERATAANWASDEDWAVFDKANEKLTYPKNIEAEQNIAFKSGTTKKVTLDHAATDDRTVTIPDATDTLAMLAAAQTLTNKTLTTPVIASLYQDAGKTNLLTLPAATDTLVGKATTDTLTNKTLTSPTIQGTVSAGTGLTMPAFTAGGDITISSFIFSTDAGAVVLADLPISTTPAAGTQESYALRIDATDILKIYGEANGAGGVKNKMIMLTQESSKPAAAAGYRGGFLLEPGGTGVADKLYCCMKSSADTYSWVQVAIG